MNACPYCRGDPSGTVCLCEAFCMSDRCSWRVKWPAHLIILKAVKQAASSEEAKGRVMVAGEIPAPGGSRVTVGSGANDRSNQHETTRPYPRGSVHIAIAKALASPAEQSSLTGRTSRITREDLQFEANQASSSAGRTSSPMPAVETDLDHLLPPDHFHHLAKFVGSTYKWTKPEDVKDASKRQLSEFRKRFQGPPSFPPGTVLAPGVWDRVERALGDPGRAAAPVFSDVQGPSVERRVLPEDRPPAGGLETQRKDPHRSRLDEKRKDTGPQQALPW